LVLKIEENDLFDNQVYLSNNFMTHNTPQLKAAFAFVSQQIIVYMRS